MTELGKELKDYPDHDAAAKLWEGFTSGFSLHYSGEHKSFESKNLPSTNKNPDGVRQKIYKEIQAGRVAGPFCKLPFKKFRISPLGLVPKHKPGEFLLIHHLSFPKGDSVNDFIDPKLCSVSYIRFDVAVHMVQRLGKGALLGKSDLKHAFRLIPVAKADFPLLGFKFDGYYFFCSVTSFWL